ncbi:unnamed protein product [Camellia sinensis]
MGTMVISTEIRYSSLPESYVRPESDRPKLSEVEDCQNVPIIDLGCEDRSLIVHQTGDKSWSINGSSGENATSGE